MASSFTLKLIFALNASKLLIKQCQKPILAVFLSLSDIQFIIEDARFVPYSLNVTDQRISFYYRQVFV